MRDAMALALSLLVCAAFVPAMALAAEEHDTGSLSGTVVAGDEEVPGAVVTVIEAVDEPACPSSDERCPQPDQVKADERGRWSLEDLGAGDYHLHVEDPSGAHAHAWWDGTGDPRETVEVTVGEQTEVDVELGPAAVVDLLVRDHRGEPLAEVTVQAERTFFSVATDVTDDAGAAQLDGLRPGRAEITTQPREAGVAEQTVTVQLDEGHNELTVDLELVELQTHRVGGRTRVETAVEASRRSFEKADTAVLASAASFPDALAAAPLAASVEGPLLLAGPRLSAPVLAELQRLETTEVVIVGAVGAVGLVVQAELDRAGLEVRRIAGETRFDTAALIAGEVGAPDGEVIVTSGVTFADALSAAPLAAVAGIPILLTGPGGLPPDTVAALAALQVERTIVVGGPAAVADEAVAQLPESTRVAGPERYATSVAVAELAVQRGLSLDTVHLATGHDFPDALAAGPVAARAGGPLLLVDGRDPAGGAPSHAFLAEHAAAVATLVALGEIEAISAEVLAHAVAMAQGAR